MIWTVVKVDGGNYMSVLHSFLHSPLLTSSSISLQSPDANYVWKLPRGAEFVIVSINMRSLGCTDTSHTHSSQILLVNQTGDLDTKWSFDPVPE